MAVTLTGGELQRRGGTFQSSEDLTSSTATTLGTISITTDVSTISGSTATGAGVNRWLCATGAVEGQEKVVILLATDEAKVQFGAGTATGSYVLSGADDVLHMRYINDGWKEVQAGSATLATATEPA